MATYSPAYPYFKHPPEVTKLDDIRVFNSGIVLDGMTQCVKDAYAAGITVGMGTDASCPFSTQYGMWREIIYFAKLGVFGVKTPPFGGFRFFNVLFAADCQTKMLCTKVLSAGRQTLGECPISADFIS